MAEILPFPTKSVRDWRIIQEALNRTLIQAGADDSARTAIIDRMKSFCSKIAREFDFSFDLPLPPLTKEQRDALQDSLKQGVERAATQIHEMTSEILLDRVLLEIQLYHLKNPPA